MSQDSVKRTLEITVPAAEVEQETALVSAGIAAKVKLPGFRPGKAPMGVIKARFSQEIRQEVLDKILPKAFRARTEQEQIEVVGTPNVLDIKFEEGEPLWFKIEFEVAPDVDIDYYKDIEVEYAEPEVAPAEIEEELTRIQESRAEFVNLDPRPAESGDFAVVSLKSLEGIEPAMEQDDVQIELGSEDTVAGFNDHLQGMTPGDEKEFEVAYPDDYASERLAGKTIRFHVQLRSLRRKELPAIDDDLAQDVGDFQTLDELKERIRANLFLRKQQEAQSKAQQVIVDKLVDRNEFPIPDAYLERQIESNIERQMRQLAANGVDVSKIKLDWDKVKESQSERAAKEVRGALIVDKVAELESIQVMQDELDQQLQLMARQERMTVPALRAKLEKDQQIGRIVNAIRTEKTLRFLFEQARKVAPKE
jgi:trigger factor